MPPDRSASRAPSSETSQPPAPTDAAPAGPTPDAGPTEPPAPTDAAPAGPTPDAGPTELVKARWVSPQPTYNPEQGVISYGEEIHVSPEQLEDEATPAIAWSDDWRPDPTLAAAAEHTEES